MNEYPPTIAIFIIAESIYEPEIHTWLFRSIIVGKNSTRQFIGDMGEMGIKRFIQHIEDG